MAQLVFSLIGLAAIAAATVWPILFWPVFAYHVIFLFALIAAKGIARLFKPSRL